MKHVVFALALLVFITGFALLADRSLAQANDIVAEQLSLALSAARAGDDARAGRAAQQAAERWSDALPRLSSLLGHEELDAVTRSLARLQQAHGAEFRALCAELLTQLKHLQEHDRPLLKNIL